ncbi:MAG: HD domain-containing protein [Ignavibacteriales bacterium]|nr:HD domain-containing protein [Ignavibacteriales bacterium]
MNEELISRAENYVRSYFEEKNPEHLYYHDFNHAVDVVKAVAKIGGGSNLASDDLEILTIASWFHDLGYINSYENHEEASAEIAEKFLKENNYESVKIEKIKSCIIATKFEEKPQNLLHEVIKDADLLHIAKKSFFDQSELLKLETEKTFGKKIDDYDWYEETLKFFTMHEFFTTYALERYTDRKRKNIAKLNKFLDKSLLKSKSDKLKEEKILIEKEKLKDKQSASLKAERGIETMFRNVIRTHVEFSAMADSKANIMISVNTLVLTAIIAILARNLDVNPHLIIPTIILTVVSLSTLILATIVTRPKITDGVFTEDDIKNKKTNLLFFGNFYKMKLDTFTWGMKEMMNDKEYLYSNMIMDFYYLGQVLGRKYKFLNICYSIFIYGMIISVLVFAIAIILSPGQTDIGSIID